MGLHEEKKTAKIIDEMILYLLKRGHKVCDIHLEYLKKKETNIIIVIDKCKEDVKDYMLKYINQKREYEVEEYGWEIMGESDYDNELAMVGLLVDTLTITEENGKYILKMYRKH